MRKFLRKISYALQVIMPEKHFVPRDTAIDVVIPVCEKDLHLLPLSLEGVRRNVCHPIAAIYIIAAENPRVREFCTRHGLRFVEESSVLGYGPAELGIQAGNPPRNRSGWIFQQLLKLSGKIGESDYFLVIDSDHILLRPHTFVADNGRLVFYGSIEYHEPYYNNIKRLMGFYPHSGMSYVAHKMIFSRRLLCSLREQIEERNGGVHWDQAIIRSLDLGQLSGFSEFELYGNFVPSDKQYMTPWRHKSFTYAAIADFDTLCNRYAARYAAITFPDYRSRGMARPSVELASDTPAAQCAASCRKE